MMNPHTPIVTDALPKASMLFDTSHANCQPFPLPGGMRGYAVAEPGLAFDLSTQETIYATLVRVTSLSFGTDTTAYWAERREQRYFARLAEFIALVDPDDTVIGWSGYSYFRDRDAGFIYCDSTGLAPGYKTRGVMREMAAARLTQFAFKRYADPGRLYVTARSESPIVYKLTRDIPGVKRLYPDPDGPTPQHVLACGRALAEWLGQSHLLQPDTLILRGAYAALEALYGELPSTGDAILDHLFRDQLGPLDAFLLVGEVESD